MVPTHYSGMLAAAVLAILRARGEKNSMRQVPLSVPELRHLLTHLFWRGWHGIEHLLRWSQWRRRHQFHALRYHYQKRGSPPANLLSTTVVLGTSMFWQARSQHLGSIVCSNPPAPFLLYSISVERRFENSRNSSIARTRSGERHVLCFQLTPYSQAECRRFGDYNVSTE